MVPEVQAVSSCRLEQFAGDSCCVPSHSWCTWFNEQVTSCKWKEWLVLKIAWHKTNLSYKPGFLFGSITWPTNSNRDSTEYVLLYFENINYRDKIKKIRSRSFYIICRSGSFYIIRRSRSFYIIRRSRSVYIICRSRSFYIICRSRSFYIICRSRSFYIICRSRSFYIIFWKSSLTL